MHKLGVIVPYRDRFQQLKQFLKVVPPYLDQQNLQYEIIVAEQADKESFNRGALLNAGFLEAKRLECDYVVFHDVDLLPRYVDYRYSDVPLELVGKIIDPSFEEAFQIKVSDLSDDYFGGVTMFPVEDFEKINGYSNKYTGWGFEDDDLLLRCREAQIPLGFKNYRQYEDRLPALTFNGKNSYVRIPFNKNLIKQGFSFLVTFRVEDLVPDPTLPHDECAIFCIPGLDAALCYESFGTYKFEVFDNYEDVYSIHSKKLPTGITMQAVVTLDSEKREGKMYLNGKEIGKINWAKDRNLKFCSNEIFLGVGHPSRPVQSNVSRKWFKGQIADFATFTRVLTKDEVWKLFSTSYLGINNSLPRQWYSARITTNQGLELPNLAGNYINSTNTDGEITNCTIEPLVSLENVYRITVPLARPGTFVGQPHETAGTQEGYWKSWATRINQIRKYHVEATGTLKHRDGLSNFKDIASVKQKLVSLQGCRHLFVTFK